MSMISKPLTRIIKHLPGLAEDGGGYKLEWHFGAGDVHTDGGFAVYRALVFANTATNATIAQDGWQLKGDGVTLLVNILAFLKLDRFFGERAHLFAHDTWNVVGPGQAAILVDIRLTDYLCSFVF